jgi:hypothetical protein
LTQHSRRVCRRFSAGGWSGAKSVSESAVTI